MPLRALLDAAEPLLDFVFRKLEERSDLTTPGGRAKALEDACRLIYPLRASYMIDTYYVQIADRVGLDVAAVRSAAARVFREVQREGGGAARPRAGARRPPASAALEPVRPHPPRPRPRTGPAPSTRVPPDVYGAAGAVAPEEPSVSAVPDAAPAVLTELERRSLRSERELLTLLTAYPDAFRAFAERIVDISWVDPRHEAIAWAVLATPAGTPPAEVMAAARAVCPEAAQLVSSGSISVTSKHPTEVNIKFLLDTLELYTQRRRLKSAQARLRQGRGLDADERRGLVIAASQGAGAHPRARADARGRGGPLRHPRQPRRGAPRSSALRPRRTVSPCV